MQHLMPFVPHIVLACAILLALLISYIHYHYKQKARRLEEKEYAETRNEFKLMAALGQEQMNGYNNPCFMNELHVPVTPHSQHNHTSNSVRKERKVQDEHKQIMQQFSQAQSNEQQNRTQAKKQQQSDEQPQQNQRQVQQQQQQQSGKQQQRPQSQWQQWQREQQLEQQKGRQQQQGQQPEQQRAQPHRLVARLEQQLQEVHKQRKQQDKQHHHKAFKHASRPKPLANFVSQPLHEVNKGQKEAEVRTNCKAKSLYDVYEDIKLTSLPDYIDDSGYDDSDKASVAQKDGCILQ